MAVSARAGLPLWIPDDVAGHCCGTPWSSKGYRRAATSDGAAHAGGAAALERRRPAAGGDRRHLVHATGCSPRLGPRGSRCSTRSPGSTITCSSACEFAAGWARSLVHPTCASKHLGLAGKLVAIAPRLADEVVVPAASGCCGMAGDRGWLHPELPASALRDRRPGARWPALRRLRVSNRTCEAALHEITGQAVRFVRADRWRSSRGETDWCGAAAALALARSRWPRSLATGADGGGLGRAPAQRPCRRNGHAPAPPADRYSLVHGCYACARGRGRARRRDGPYPDAGHRARAVPALRRPQRLPRTPASARGPRRRRHRLAGGRSARAGLHAAQPGHRRSPGGAASSRPPAAPSIPRAASAPPARRSPGPARGARSPARSTPTPMSRRSSSSAATSTAGGRGIRSGSPTRCPNCAPYETGHQRPGRELPRLRRRPRTRTTRRAGRPSRTGRRPPTWPRRATTTPGSSARGRPACG